MLDPKTLEEIGNKMNALLANSPAKDLEKNAKAAVSGLLAKLDRRHPRGIRYPGAGAGPHPRKTEGTRSPRRGAGKSDSRDSNRRWRSPSRTAGDWTACRRRR